MRALQLRQTDRCLRATCLAGVLLFAITLAVFQQLSRHPGDLLVGPQAGGKNDLVTAFLAFRTFPSVAWERFGQFPFWNPYSQEGRPWLGNPQAAMFYPPNWICLFAPSPATLSWLMVLHLWWAGLGAYLLCRRGGCSWAASVLGGTIFLAAPYLVAHTGEGHYNQICVAAWIPWAIWAYERMRLSERGRTWGLVLVLGMGLLGGHVQEWFYLVLILTVFVAVDVLRAVRTGTVSAGARLAGIWISVFGLVLGLFAFEWLPAWTYSRHSVRAAGLTADDVSQISLGMENLGQLLNPFHLGGPDSYIGPGKFYWETLCHFGVLPLCLAVVGLFRIPHRSVRFMACLFAGALLFAFGAHTPFFVVLHKFVPGVALFRAPSRSLFFCSLALAVLAAHGAEFLRTLIAPSGPSGELTTETRGWAVPTTTKRSWGAGPTLRIGPEPKPLRQWMAAVLPAVLIVCCALELSLLARRLLRTAPAASIRRDSTLCAFLKSQSPGARVLVDHDLLGDWEAWLAGIHKAQGYEPVPLLRDVMAVDALVPDQDPAVVVEGFASVAPDRLQPQVADLFGIRYCVTRQPVSNPPHGWKAVSKGSVAPPLVLRGRNAHALPYVVYENQSVLPRAFVVGKTRQLRPGEDLVSALKSLNPRDAVLLKQDVLPSGPRTSLQPASLVEDTPNRVVAEVELAQPGYLVLSDIWYPGWEAEDNGSVVPVLNADVAFRAVPLPAGTHRVVFRFVPPGLTLGCLVSLVTLLMTTAFRLPSR